MITLRGTGNRLALLLGKRMSVQAHYSTGKGGLVLANSIMDASGGAEVKSDDLIGACEFHTGGRAGTD